MPAVGDWVAITRPDGGGRATIHAVLPRRTKLSRKVPERGIEEQVLAANVDVVFLVTSLNRELRLRRLERYVATAWESGATPVILLTKSDLSDRVEAAREEVEAIALGAPVHVLSCVTGEGLENLPHYFAGHRTAVFLGSSGVGKSTLINALAGRELQRELRALEVKVDKRLQADERKKRRAFARQLRRPKKW